LKSADAQGGVAALAAMKDLNELVDGLPGHCSGFGDRFLEQLPFWALKKLSATVFSQHVP